MVTGFRIELVPRGGDGPRPYQLESVLTRNGSLLKWQATVAAR